MVSTSTTPRNIEHQPACNSDPEASNETAARPAGRAYVRGTYRTSRAARDSRTCGAGHRGHRDRVSRLASRVPVLWGGAGGSGGVEAGPPSVTKRGVERG